MSRRKKKPLRRVSVPIEKLNAIVARARTEPLPADEHATLQAAVDTLARLTEELETTTTTLERVRRLIFGPRSETTETVLGKGKTDAPDTTAAADTPSIAGAAATPPAADPERKQPRPGHGRHGAEKYPRAPRLAVTHDTLKHGDPCPQPDCTGRVYVQRQEPAVLVRLAEPVVMVMVED